MELYHCTQDYSRPFPMSMPVECRTMAETPLHKSTVQRVTYNLRGTKLASASSDMTINILKTPVITKLEVTTLQGHNA